MRFFETAFHRRILARQVAAQKFAGLTHAPAQTMWFSASWSCRFGAKRGATIHDAQIEF